MLRRRLLGVGSTAALVLALSACGLPGGGDPPPDECPVDSDTAENPIAVVLDANGDATYEGCAHDDLESDYYLFDPAVDGRLTITCEALVGTIGGFLDSPSYNAGVECPFDLATNVDSNQTAFLEIWGGRPDSLGNDPYTLTFHWVPD